METGQTGGRGIRMGHGMPAAVAGVCHAGELGLFVAAVPFALF